jgi:hypothetical protein
MNLQSCVLMGGFGTSSIDGSSHEIWFPISIPELVGVVIVLLDVSALS